MASNWDLIVLGIGGFGSAAAAHAARAGARVLGLEQHEICHSLGSSHGETRIIRKAYFEHPDYVPLLEHAYRNWADLEQASNRKLFERVGLFLAGEENSLVVKGTSDAARMHNLPLEHLSPTEARQRFPNYAFRDSDAILFEADAGFLRVEECVRQHVELAKRHGAEIREHAVVQGWKPSGNGVEVRTDSEVLHADRLIVTAGAWTSRLLTDLGIPLEVKRKVALWFDTPKDRYQFPDSKPTFFFDRPAGAFYGFPSIDGATVKLAEHTGGMIVENPDTPNRDEIPEDLHNVIPFVRESLPHLTERRRHSVCFYTCTPDGHFIIDRHPEFPQVTIGAGFSGHGFKFTSGLGETLSELALQGRTSQPIQFLSIAAGLDRLKSD